MLPHQWIASIATLPQAESLLGFSHMEAFWNGVSAEDPRLQSWPCEYPSPANTKGRWLPLFLHGDGVEYSSGQSPMVVTIGAHGHELARQHVLPGELAEVLHGV